MNSDDGDGETKTLVYVNQPYINLAVAGGLRDTIDGHLDEGGCSDALRCNALGIQGVYNSLLTGVSRFPWTLTMGFTRPSQRQLSPRC